MHWVYILKCEGNRYYVGETTRLLRRFWEHYSERGGTNTQIFQPIELVALYKVNMIGKFIHYDNIIGQHATITECLMIKSQDNLHNIRNEKYMRFDVNYKFLQSGKHVLCLPLCKCGLPCDVKNNYSNNYLYFRYAKKIS